MTPEEKQALIEDMEHQIKTYSKWIDEYKQKIEAAKYIINIVKSQVLKDDNLSKGQ